MKVLTVEFDEKCTECNNAMKIFKNLNFPEIPKDKALVILPDINSSGIITKYHLAIVKNKHIKW